MEIYAAVMFFDAAVALALAVYAWQHRRALGSPVFVLFMLIGFIWSMSTGISVISSSVDAANIWLNKIRYFPIAILPVTFMIFTLQYTGRQRFVSPVTIGSMLIIPILTQIVIWFGSPELFLYDIHFVQIDGFTLLQSSDNGIWFWVHTIYSYVLMLGVLGMLAVQIFRSTDRYQGQAVTLFIGGLMPFIANMVAVLGPDMDVLFDWTSIGFTITGVIWAWALYRYQLLNIMPIARDAVIESMDDLVIVLDLEVRVVDVNPAFTKTLNLERAAIVGKPLVEVLPAQASLIDQFSEVLEARTEISVGDEDNPRYLDMQLSTLYQRKDRATGRLVVLRDVTERKLADIERDRLIGDLRAYAHSVAHDLKNPLGVISGSVDFLTATVEQLPVDRRLGYYRIIRQTTDKMNSIIEELLLLASIREQTDISMKPLNMGDIVTEARVRVRLLIEERSAEIKEPDHWPSGVGHAPWVEAVWANLLSNAVKYGGDPPQIELGAESKNGMIHYWIKDNGPGLTAEAQSHLFDPFSRFDPDRAKGHGLGLSIVYRIVERLGGTVTVETAEGKGSTFRFTLPAA